jgi:hypothetical protein
MSHQLHIAACTLLALCTSVAVAAEADQNPGSQEIRRTLPERWVRNPGTTCAHEASLPAPLREALDLFCKDADDPAKRRAEMIGRLIRSPGCYVANTPEEYAQILRETALIPASLLGQNVDERFASSGTVWNGDGGQSASGRAQRANLTYSFPLDNVQWGVAPNNGPNDLNARLSGFFGSGNKDRAIELMRQMLAGYRRASGLTYTETADDNIPFTFSPARSPGRGDIRFGSVVMGFNGFYAFNYFPDSGSDMVINSSYFGDFSGQANNYRLFRNTIGHEHGHGLSFYHVIPCSGTKLMEPFIISGPDMAQVDDIRGAQSCYGDRFAGNNSAANARDFGNLTSPASRSVIEQDLSTNGAAGFGSTNEDWFRFTIDSPQNLVIRVTPTGGTYNAIVNFNNADCNGAADSVDAVRAGNLNIELRSADGATVIQSAAVAGPGFEESLTRNAAAAGTYTVRVVDAGPNPSINQIVQLYNLTVRVGTSKAPPQAIAGVNKRVGQGFPCWFRGDINSRVNEPGASIASFQWDFDNNGTFDATGPEVSTVYNTIGVRTVRLRVTDSNGMTADDTIQVNVFDATPPPPPGAFNLLSPLNGANTTDTTPTLDWSDSAGADAYRITFDDNADFSCPIINNFEVSGSEVTLSPGTVSIGTTYYWKVTAVNPFGTVASTPVSRSFTVIAVPPPCPGDLDGDGFRNTVDLVIFLGRFGLSVVPGTNGDLDNNGVVRAVSPHA